MNLKSQKISPIKTIWNMLNKSTKNIGIRPNASQKIKIKYLKLGLCPADGAFLGALAIF